MTFSRTWKCPACGNTVEWSYEDMIAAGNPICTANGCDREMELLPEPRVGRHEVCLIVPARSARQAKEVKEMLEKEGHVLCVALGRKRDNHRVVIDPQRPKLCLVIEMYGGTIQNAHASKADVDVTDVVFTEDPKYGETDGQSIIVGGPLDGQFIYAHYGQPDTAGLELFGPVMKAAQARIAAAKGAEKRKEP